VISRSAKDLTTGEVQAHLADVYEAEVSRQTISTITDKMLDGMAESQNRSLHPTYPVTSSSHPRRNRDGKITNRPMDAALAVTVDGERDILGLWAGDGGEGAKHWCQWPRSNGSGASFVCAVRRCWFERRRLTCAAALS
jgi:putative transposase